MLKYIVTRILQFIPVIIGTTFLTFVLLQVVPGDPIAQMMKEHISPEVVARVRAEMHLDDPWLQRYRALHVGCGSGQPRHLVQDAA